MANSALRIIPLGGTGEIGKNATVIEYGDEALLIDCGLKFPEEEMLGIDLVIPDMRYLHELGDRLHGIIITHGHEDHIGALPYVLADLDVPIYATRLTQGLIEVKLREHKLLGKRLIETIKPGVSFRLGAFEVLPFGVTHSIPDAVGFAVTTPAGTLVHTGDFKFDQTPVYGQPTDFGQIADIGRRGVLMLLSDCTRVEKTGYTPSERVVARTFDEIVRECPGRIIMTTFASNIIRVQQAIDVAYRFGRKVALVGRSMENNCSIANDLGYLNFPPDTVYRLDDLRRVPHDQIVLVTTGSQGEPSSVLSRIASNDHRQIKIAPDDTVILSATPIPGNEETVSRTIDNLMRQGASVIYEPLADVHVSGHGSREDLKLMLNLLRPRFCMPIHGDYRHLVHYRQLAMDVGIPGDNIVLADIGDVIEVDAQSVRKTGRVTVGSVLVDGIGVGTTTEVVLRDRQHLSRDGILIIVVAIDRMTGEIVSGPEVISRGFVQAGTEGDAILAEAQNRLTAAFHVAATGMDHGFVVSKIKEVVSEYVYKQMRARPMILPVVTEV